MWSHRLERRRHFVLRHFRGCAQTVYFSLHDITEGWRTACDLERLEKLVDLLLRAVIN